MNQEPVNAREGKKTDELACTCVYRTRDREEGEMMILRIHSPSWRPAVEGEQSWGGGVASGRSRELGRDGCGVDDGGNCGVGRGEYNGGGGRERRRTGGGREMEATSSVIYFLFVFRI